MKKQSPIKCDYCDNTAVRSYQKVWVSYYILKDNKYSEPRLEEKLSSKINICKKCEKEPLKKRGCCQTYRKDAVRGCAERMLWLRGY